MMSMMRMMMLITMTAMVMIVMMVRRCSWAGSTVIIAITVKVVMRNNWINRDDGGDDVDGGFIINRLFVGALTDQDGDPVRPTPTETPLGYVTAGGSCHLGRPVLETKQSSHPDKIGLAAPPFTDPTQQ